MTFPYTLYNNDRIAVIRPMIPLESRTSGELKSLSEQLLSRGISHIVIDAEKTDYISSEGLHTLFTLHRLLVSSGGLLVVSRPTREVKSLFRVLQLAEHIPVTETLEQGIKTAETAQASIPVKETVSTIVETSPPQENSAEKTLSDPLVVECESCGAFVRAGSTGKFMCPSCQAEFTVTDEGTVVF
jgi:anti-anti-sigma factor